MSPNPLRSIFNKAASFLSSRDDGGSVVGIDIGTSSIKVVQVREENGRAVLETYGSIALGPFENKEAGEVTTLSSKKLTEALDTVLAEAGVTATRAAIAIPASASLVFVVSLPRRVSAHDFDQVVPTEARKYIPVPVSEVTLDWWRIPRRQDLLSEYTDQTGASQARTDEPVEVLVAAIHNDTLTNYRNIMNNAAKVQADAMEIEVFSTIRSTYTRDLSTFLVMDIGAAKTKLAIADAGIVRSFHIINRGSADLSNAIATSLNVSFGRGEEFKRDIGLGSWGDVDLREIIQTNLNFIFSEATSVVRNYERKYNDTIKRVLLTGGGALLPGMRTFAGEQFQADVVFGNPFAKTQAPAFLESTLEETGPEFAVATGLALRLL